MNWGGNSVDLNFLEVIIGEKIAWDSMDAKFAVLFTVMTFICTMTTYWEFSPRLSVILALLIGWIVGFVSSRTASSLSAGLKSTDAEHYGVRLLFPLTLFHRTLPIDYHLLGNLLLPIIFASIILYFVNVVFLTVVMYSINIGGTPFIIKIAMAVNLSVMISTQSVRKLKSTHSQSTHVQTFLHGEMVLTLVLTAWLQKFIILYKDTKGFVEISNMKIIQIAFYNLLSIPVGLLASFALRKCVYRNYEDFENHAACLLAMILLLFNGCNGMGMNGTLGVLAFAVAQGLYKIKLGNEATVFYKKASELHSHIADLLLALTFGYIGGRQIDRFTMYDTSYALIVYATCLISRTVTLFSINHILKDMKMNLDWQHLALAIQGPTRSLEQFVFLEPYLLRQSKGANLVVRLNLIFLSLSYLLNNALLERTMKGIGMFDLSRAKILNMNLAVSQLNECRSRAIQGLMADRVIADANWIIVEETTILEHPYKNSNQRTNFDNDAAEFENEGQLRVVYCGECGTKGSAPLAKSEMQVVSHDIKCRILKAQRVSFNKQYELKTLGVKGFSLLTNLVERALVRTDPIIMAKDLKFQVEGTRFMRWLKKKFQHLHTVTSVKHKFIPTSWIRTLCFRLCTLRSYQICMASISMLDLVNIITLLQCFYTGTYGSIIVLILQIIDLIFYFVFFIEFIIEILGIGVIQYFQSFVNLVEFACICLVRSLELGLSLETYLEYGELSYVFNTDPIIMHVKTLLLLRVTRIYVFILTLIPKIMNLIDKKFDHDLEMIYDIGKAFMISQAQAIKFLGQLVSNEEIFQRIAQVLETDRLTVAEELGYIRHHRATISTTNITCHAVHFVISNMSDCISSMRDEEYLDQLELTLLYAELEDVKKKVITLKSLRPLEGHRLVSEIAWLKNNTCAIEFLMKHCRVSSFSPEQIIVQEGTYPSGIILIVEGMVKATYIPTFEVLEMNTKFGMIPNYDFFTNLKFKYVQSDFLGKGAIIGEMGVATKRKYNMKVVAVTSVHIMWFPIKILNILLSRSSSAILWQASIWKSISIKIAANVLESVPMFRSWSKEKLFMYLQAGVIPIIKGVPSISIDDNITDVILVEGIAMDYATRLVYHAPCYIPRTVATLILPGFDMIKIKTTIETKLLLIPDIHADAQEISGDKGLFKEYIRMKEKEANMTKEGEIRKRAEDPKCRKGHKKFEMSPFMKRLLKSQRKAATSMKFIDYVPTVTGPVETTGLSTRYLVQGTVFKGVTASETQKTKNCDSSIGYITDVAENSEIEELRGDDDDDYDPSGKRKSSSRRSGSKKSISSSMASDRSARSITNSTSMGTSQQFQVEVIESTDEEDTKGTSKKMQTDLELIDRHMFEENYDYDEELEFNSE